MRARTLLGLATLAAGLLCYVMLVERPATDATRAEGRSRLLPGLQRDRVVRISFLPERRPPIALVKDARRDRWSLAGPPRLPADGERVDAVLSALEFTEVWRRPPHDSDRRQLGLDPPRLRLRVHLQGDDQPTRLSLGAVDVSGTGLYVARNGALLVVPAGLYEQLDLDVETLQDRDLVPFASTQIDRLTLAQKRTQEVTVLVGEGNDWFVVDEGGRVRADPEAVYELLGSLGALRASRFAEHQHAGDVEATVRIQAADEQVVLAIGDRCAGRPGARRVTRRFAGRRVDACVNDEEIAAINPPRSTLFDAAPTRVATQRLTRLRIERSGATIDLKRDATRWVLTTRGGPRHEADPDAIRDWVEGLSALSGQVELLSGVQSLPAALGELAQVTLWPERGKARRLAFGRPTPRGVPLRRDDEPALLWLPEAVTGQLSVRAELFFSRRVLSIEAGTLERIRVLAASTGADETVVRREAGWVVAAPFEMDADASLMGQLEAQLISLRARRFVESSAFGKLPGSTFDVALQLGDRAAGARADSAGRSVRLTVRRQRDGRCVARGSGALPYELDEADCELILAPKAARRLFRFDRASVSRLAFRWLDGRRELRRHGGGWYAGDGHRLSRGEAQGLIDWLAELKAERVVRYGARPQQRAPWQVDVESAGGLAESCAFSASGVAWCSGRPVVYRMTDAFIKRLNSTARGRR